jgi:hypothetical protein
MSSSGRVVWFDVLLFFFEVSLCLQLVRIDDSEITTSPSISKKTAREARFCAGFSKSIITATV